MDFPDNKDYELQRREQELQERERAIRLRELEAEVNQAPLHKTTKHQHFDTLLNRWSKKITKVAAFVGIIVMVIVAIKVAQWLASVVIVGGIAFWGYKILMETENPKNK